MTEKTRVRLGAYFLFALVLLTLPATLVITHLDTARHAVTAVASDDGVSIKNFGATKQAVEFFQKRDGVSPQAALREANRQMREHGDRLLDDVKLPYGAQLDFYKVDGTKSPTKVSFEGSARVMDPKSVEGMAFADSVNYSADVLKKDRSLWDQVQAQMKKGYLLAPLSWFETPLAEAAARAANMMGTRAVTTTQYKVCVIATEFPGFTDYRPRSNGDLDPNNDGWTVYRYSNLNSIQNYPPSTDGGMDDADPQNNSILDSPGGVFSTTNSPLYWGVPNGIPDTADTNWDTNQTFAARGRAVYMSDNALGVGMDDLIYDQGQSALSLSNFLWQNSHGNIRMTGSYGAGDVVGWISSAHVLNRYKYREQIQPYVLPGTPIFREEWQTACQAQKTTANNKACVIRASLNARGLTILFDRNVTSFTRPTLTVYQTQDCNSVASGTNNSSTLGEIQIEWNNSTYYTNRDPYDARRWTIVQPAAGNWKFTDRGDATKLIGYAVADGYSWTISWPGGEYELPGGGNLAADIPYGTVVPAVSDAVKIAAGLTLVRSGNIKNGQNRGCPNLPTTAKGVVTWSGTEYAVDIRGTTIDDWGPLYTSTGTLLGYFGDRLLGQIDDGPPTNQGYVFSRPFNRLCAYSYYTHAYFPASGSANFYQVSHLRNESDYNDDIAGTQIPNSWSYRMYTRPIPFDYDPDDSPNAGYFDTQFETNAWRHRSTQWEADVALILKDENIDALHSGKYQKFIYVYPSPTTTESNNPNRSEIIPHGGGNLAVLPEAFTYKLASHEIGHTLQALDLYDHDFYANRTSPAPTPQWHVCDALNPYSIMGHGGSRFDAWHKIALNWITQTNIRTDTLGVNIPEVEGTVYDPVILKLPANPYYIYKGTDPDAWQEYFLVENRNLVGANYFGDQSSRGLYIYHVDERNCAQYEAAATGGPGKPTAGTDVKTYQRDDANLTVAIEQADGKRELEVNADGESGNITTDPFGNNTIAQVTRFWQFPSFPGTKNDFNNTIPGLDAQGNPTAVGVDASAGSPTSFSHGYTYAERDGGVNVLIPNTATDSFTRVMKISAPGQVMTADVYVRPAEIIASRVTMPNTPPATVRQGDANVPFMVLKLENRGAAPNVSMGNVYLDTLRILESGTSTVPDNLSAVKLYLDVTKNGVLDLPGDTLLASTTLDTDSSYPDHAVFNNLGFLVPLDNTPANYRQLIIAYDIAPEAQTNPRITVGAEFTDVTKILPRVPGAVQDRIRLGEYDFGASRFPIQTRDNAVPTSTNTSVVHNFPDRLLVTQPTAYAYAARDVTPSEANVPLLRLRAQTNKDGNTRTQGFVTISQIKVDAEDPNATGFEATNELLNATLYRDVNKDGTIDGGDTKLGEASFTVTGGVKQAVFINLNEQILAGAASANEYIIAANLAAGATPGHSFKFHVKFETPGDWASGNQANCYVSVANPVGEDAANKDWVDWQDGGTNVYPIVSPLATIVEPNTAPNRVVSGFDPTGGAVVFDQNPTLKWDAPNPADPDADDTAATMSYRVDVSTDGTFTGIIRSVNPTTPAGTTSWTVSGAPLPAGTYYWRVKSIDRHGKPADNWSDTQQFVVQLNSPPNAVTAAVDPLDGTVVTVVNATDTPTPTLQWAAASDPDPGDTPDLLHYVVQVDDNSDFSSPLAIGAGGATQWTGTAGVTTMTVPASAGLKVGVKYYWRVQTVDDQGATSLLWSATWSFTPVVNRAPATPVGAFSPTGSAEVSSANPVLTWNMPGTPDPDSPSDRLANIHYEVQLATSADLAAVTAFTFTATTAVNTLTTTVNTVSLVDDTHYYWRVRSVDDQGLKSVWSAVQDFWVNSINDTPSPPTTGWEPAQGATTNDSTPALSWDNSPDPDVDITDGAFTNAAATPPIVGVSWVVELVSTSLTAAPPTTNADDGSFATVTPQYTYTTGPLAAAGRPALAVTTPLTENVWWYWHVKAVDNDGARSTTWSTLQHFRVRTDYNPPTAPTSGFVPATGSSISPDATHALRLEWNPGADTEDPITQLRYEVELSSNNTFTTTPGYYWASGLGTAARTYVDVPATPVLTAGTTYYWRVRTVDKNCLRSAWSTTQTFTVVANNPPNAVTTGFAPTGTQQISDRTPDLRWNAATPPDPDADDTAATMTYQVQVDDNSAFTSPEFTGTTAVGATTINVTTTLTVGVRYYWRVLPVDRKGLAATAWSATQDFRVVANQAPAAPTSGFDPSDGEEITTATPRIQWNAGTDPNTDDTAATLTYEIQVKADPDLSSGPYAFTATTTVGGQTYVDVTTPLPDNGHFYYRIRTIDDGGLSSPWTTSTLTHFYVNTGNNAPTAPTTGFNPPSGSTTNDTTPLLSWDNSTDPDLDPFDGAVTAAPVVGVHFEVQLSRSNTFVPVAYTYTTAPGVSSVQCGTLTDGVQWYWRVQTIDDDGTPSGYGAAQTLFINSTANAPTTPTGLAPGTGASVSSTTPLLSWTAGTDVDAADTAAALRYEVQVASSATFAMTPYFWPSGLTPAGQTYVYVAPSSPLTQGSTYYWRVRTVDTTNLYSAWSAGQQFTVVANRAPNQVVNGFDPASGSTITDRTPVLAWSAASPPDPDADDTAATMRYYVEVDNNADFRSPEFGPALTTLPLADPLTPSITVTTTLPVGVTYYWHVKAMDAKNLQCTNWSATQNFRIVTDQAPATPIATFTPSGAIEVGPPTLTWNDPNPPSPPDPNPSDTIDTIKYDVQVSASADFSGTLVYTGQTGEGEAYMVVPAGTWVDDTHYYWRVRAVDRQGLTSAWTAIQDFWCNTGNDAPNPPTSGFSPADQSGVNDSTPRLSWDPATDPDQSDPATTLTYRVALSKDNFATVAYTYNVAVAGRTFLDVPSALTDNTTWYWHVAAVDNDGAVSAWSTTLRFNLNTANNAPDAPLSGFIPSGGVNVSDTTPNLSWNAATDPNPTDTPDTLHYEVQLSSDNTFPSPAPAGTYFYSVTTADGIVTVTVPAANALTTGTTYYWRVRTVDGGGLVSAAWSATQTFVVGANQSPNAPTSGFSPAGGVGVSDRTPIMSWNAGTDPDANDTADVLRYNLQVDDNSDFSSPTFRATTAYGQTSIECTPAGGLAEGVTYYWRVQTQDAAGALSAWSAVQNFHVIANRAPYAPIAVFTPVSWPPINTANPTLTWSMPATPDPDPNDTLDTLKYEVQLNNKEDLANGPYVFTATTLVNVMQAVCTVNLADNAQYWWRVRSVDAQSATSDWSDVQTFWINLSNQAPAAPDSGFDPADGEQVSDDTPLMSWIAATDADPDDTAGTLHYIVELSTSPTLATVSYQYTTADGVTQITPTAALTDRTTWYWRVRTVDNDGAVSAWSVIQSFYLDKGNQMPTLTDPQVVQPYGALGDYYQLYVTYNDAENDAPGWVRCTFDNGVGPLDMRKVNAADNDATNGIQYVVGVAGSTLGLGAHHHAFTCQAGIRLPALATDWLTGPTIGVKSRVRLMDSHSADVTQYEEGSVIWIEVIDADQNLDPATRETVTVTVTEQNGDTEDVVLTETNVATGNFHGSIQSLGRAGASGDGVLNAIAGTSGNTVTLTYTDPDDGANPTPDTGTDTAGIVDTTPPAAVNALPTLSSGIHGRSVNVDWTSYSEDKQVDVAGYHVWISTSQFTTTAGLTALPALPAGTQTLTVTQLPSGTALAPNTTYWIAVTAFDEVPNERTTVTSQSIVTRDSTAPTIAAQNPAPGSTEVARNTPITFSLDDPGVGIDQSTLVVTLWQGSTVIGHATPTLTGDQYSYQVTVVPSAAFAWNATVRVWVDVKDFDGNQLLVNDTLGPWSFKTVTDTVLPTLDDRAPTADATNVPVTTNISFSLHDSGSGINQAATQLIFNGTDVSSSLTFTALADGVRATYNPTTDLLYNSQYTVSATGFDNAGNSTGPVNWSFNTVVDAGAVTADLFDPARNAVGVPINTNVSFRLSDSLAGIVASSFRLWVAGSEVTGSADLTIVKVPADSDHPTTMAVSYNPPADFAYSTDVAVRLYAEDRVGNVTDMTYSFRTADAPTYNVSGIITTAAGVAIPGVTVTAGGQTATTDGNGSYRIGGLLAGAYVVIPARAEYVFTPPTASVTLGPDDAVANFTGALQTYALSGTIKEGTTPLAGVTVTCDGLTATTDANGAYRIAGLPNGTYTVTPALRNYHFQPATKAAQIISADLTGVDFEAVADTFSIGGQVKDNTGAAVEGVQITCGTKSTVTDAAGTYVVAGLRAGTYTVSAAKDGYQIVDADDSDSATISVTVPPTTTTADFTANIEMSSTFPAGLNFIGVPGLPLDTNPMNVFDLDPTQGEICYRWNPAATPPQYLVAQNDPTAAAVQVRAGRGFFVSFADTRTVRVAGTPTSTSTSIGLTNGWNMIANPLSQPVKFGNFVPTVPGAVKNYAFVYDNTTGSYQMVSSDASLGAARSSILGWEGAWVRATSSGVSLTVAATAGTAADKGALKPTQADLNGGWTLPIVARAGNRADASSLAGAVPGSDGAQNVENPPALSNTVDVYFTDGSGAKLAHDVRSSLGTQTFTFVVACTVADADVTLTLPDLSNVPNDYQVLLADKQTGKTLYARTVPSYTYRSSGDSSERTFELTVSPRTIGALAVTASAAQTRGSNVALTYTVTRACSMNVRVLNIAGRCVRQLVTEKAVTAGVQTELWNLCATNGTMVPSGLYLLQLEAVTDTGQRVRTMTQVRVTR